VSGSGRQITNQVGSGRGRVGVGTIGSGLLVGVSIPTQ